MKQRLSYICILILVAVFSSAQDLYRSAELRRLAETLSIDPTALAEGYNQVAAKGKTLCVHKTGGMVDHIGLRLFSDELRRQQGTAVLDFLERYFLQLQCPPLSKSSMSMMRDDQFQFLTGSVETIADLLSEDDFSCSNSNHRYTATWSRKGQTLLAVSFPAEYQLMSGENKIEAEERLAADILSTPVPLSDVIPALPSADTYLTDDFSCRLYRIGNELVSSVSHPAETVANMMLSTQTKGDYTISMTQMMYGFRKTAFSLPLKQWIAYCQSCGCNLYYAVEDVSVEGDVKAVVIAVNLAEGYNHVLTVTVPSVVISQQQGTLDARLYPYVPTHNVKSLFADFRKHNSSTPKTFVSQ